MQKLTTLFSGSSGNCTLIQKNNTNILVDAGFSYGKIADHLTQLNLSPSDISAIFVTHEHTDHISALKEWSRNQKTPIFAHKSIASFLQYDQCCQNIRAFDDNVTVDDLQMQFTFCSHDSQSCCGFKFLDGSSSVAVLTDTGVVSQQNLEFLSDCTTVMLESNHDLYMLKIGDYSYPLKKRIMSPRGHLSNVQAADVLDELIQIGKLKNIVLGHLSQNNNTRELVFFQAMNVLTKHKLVEGKDINIFVADQFEMGKSIEG